MAGVETARFEPATSCLQTQIGRGRHLARRRTAQVMAAVGLSVGVRLRPLASLVNGKVVARPTRRPGWFAVDVQGICSLVPAFLRIPTRNS